MPEDNASSLAAIHAQMDVVDASLQEVARLFDDLHRSRLDGGIMTADTAAELVRTHAATRREQAGAPEADGITQRIAPVQALRSEEEDTTAGTQPVAATSTARAEIRAVLLAVGYNQAAADELLRRADREPHAQPADEEFEATLAGGHALVLEHGDCETYGTCQCGRKFGVITPDIPLDHFGRPWEQHLMTEVSS